MVTPARPIPKRFATSVPILCLALAALTTTGCWRVLMDPDTLRKTTPFGQGAAASGTQLAKQSDRVNGWPLFYRNRDAMSVVWPLFVKRENVSALLPFYEYIDKEEKDRTQLLLAMEILGAGWGTDYRANHVFPAWFYKRAGETKRWNAFLVSGGYRKPDFKSDYLFPLAYYGRGKDESTFCSIPYFSRQTQEKRSKAVGLVLYDMFQNKDRTYRSVLFPFAHFWNSSASRGHAILPLYAWWRFSDGGAMFNSLPFSVCRSDKKDVVNVGGPLYYHSRTGDTRFASVLWPIYMQKSSPRESFLALLPLFAKSTTPHSRTLLCPLFYARKDTATSTSLFVSPLWSAGMADDARWSNCGVLLAHVSKDSKRSDYSFLADSVHVRNDRERGRKVSVGASFVRAFSIDRDGFYFLLSGHTNTLPGDGSIEAFRRHVEETPENDRSRRWGGKRETFIFLALSRILWVSR